MRFLDKKYANLLSGSLSRFTWKGDGLANFDCPFCGDKKRKAYLFTAKDGNLRFWCHKGCPGKNFRLFLNQVSPTLAKQYMMEIFANTPKASKHQHDELEEKAQAKPIFGAERLLKELPTLASLDSENEGVRYARSRKIPDRHFSNLYYCEAFVDFVKKLNPDKIVIDGPRLVIPIYTKDRELAGIQARNLDETRKDRYCTIRLIEDEKLCYGVERIDPTNDILVLEGPIDSMFLDNAVAILGLTNTLNSAVPPDKAIYVIDNQPRHKEVITTLTRLIKSGKRVCIWPQSVSPEYKDINDMVKNGGMTPARIVQTIKANTFSGLLAEVQLAQWRKV